MNIIKKNTNTVNNMVNYILVTCCLYAFTTRCKYESGEAGNFIDANYVYSIDSHIKQIKEFYHYITHNPGLGKYRDNITNLEHITDKVLKSLWIIIPALFLSLLAGIAKGIFDYWSKDKKAQYYR